MTADLVKRTMRLKCSTKLIQTRLHERGIYFKTRGSTARAVEHCACKQRPSRMLMAFLDKLQYPHNTRSIPTQYPLNTHTIPTGNYGHAGNQRFRPINRFLGIARNYNNYQWVLCGY